jgi:hypothetical protein
MPDIIPVPVPKDFLPRLAQAMINSYTKRIREDSVTGDGEPLSRNNPYWRDVKQGKVISPTKSIRPRPTAISDKPLVYTGAMTDPDTAWHITTTENGFTITLQGTAARHASTIIKTSHKKQTNWIKAFKLSGIDTAAMKTELLKLIAEDKYIPIRTA